MVKLAAAGGEGGVAAGDQTPGQNQVINQLYKHVCNLVLVPCSRLGPVRGPE